jgi:hypothetical protein
MTKDFYPIIRQELKKETGKYPRYFTRAFCKNYLSAAETLRKNRAAGIDSSFRKPDAPYVVLFREYIPVYESYFYKKDSCNYCVFLEIVNRLNLL